MKLVILIALIALAVAAPAEKKPVDDKKAAEKTEEKKKEAVEKPEEKKDEERKGLQWPLPDPDNEGDLMLHGAHLFDRVDELRKGKSDKDEDKMVLSVGREYLRRVHKYIEKNTDFKILSVLCRDSERLNSTDRWEIRLHPQKRPQFVFPSTDGQTEKQSTQTEQVQGTKQQKQNDATQTKDTKQNDPIVASNNSTHENATENANVNATDAHVGKERPTFETINKEYYERMGDNFARVLMKRFRKEKMEKEETQYLERWVSDESIHYGMMGIYCHDGENVKELVKRINTLIEEKQ